MNSIVWLDPFKNPPDWKDGGPTLFLKDGRILEGHLLIDELFTGEDEIPSPMVTLPDGSHPSFYDFDGWAKKEKDPC